MNTNEQAAAIAAAEQAARKRPGDFDAFEALGHAYFEADRRDEAMTAYRRAIQLNPHAARAYESIGHLHYLRDDPEAAIAAYEQAILHDPLYTISYFGLGILHANKTGDFNQAVSAYRRGLQANPGDPFLTAHLGGTFARMGHIDQGIELLEQAVNLDPNNAFAWGWLNMLYLHQHRFEDSLEACLRRNGIEEDHSSYRLMGFIYHAQGHIAEAAAALERAIALEPDDYEARAALARIYRETGRLEAAEEHFQQAWETAWQDEEYGRACVQAVSGNFDEALALLEKAIADNHVTLGWVRIDPEFAFLQDDPRFQALFDLPEPQ